MFEFIIGVAVGAIFSPFWMKVWTFVSEKVENIITK